MSEDQADTMVSSGTLLDDDDFLPQERARPSRLTIGLIAALVLLLGLLGGIWLQKQLGVSSSARVFPAGGQAGFPGSGQGRPDGSAGGGGGFRQPQPSTTGGSGTTADTPAVVGTVTSIKGSRLVVTDLRERVRQVTIAKNATLTTPYGHGGLKKGDAVSVVGTTSGEVVTATALTVR